MGREIKKDPCCSITALTLLAWILAGKLKMSLPALALVCSLAIGTMRRKGMWVNDLETYHASELGVPTHFQRGRGEPARKQSKT